MQYHRRATSNPRARKKPVYATTDEADAITPVEVRQTQPAYEEDELEAGHRVTSLTRRYGGLPMPDGVLYRQGHEQIYVHHSPPPVRRASRYQQPVTTEARPAQMARRRFHWLMWVGLVALVMIGGYVALGAFGSWWHTHSDDSTYGRPRTFQIDAVVGHSDSPAHPSHFLALNLKRHVIVIEIPGGDVSKAILYSGPILLGDGQDLTPVTLSFADVNGDGRPDMQLHILDQTLVFLNTGTRFVPPSPLAIGGGSHPPTQGEA
jgi:hypothetical protein